MKRWLSALSRRFKGSPEPRAASDEVSPPVPEVTTPQIETVFVNIYRSNAWLNEESRSGPGSTVARCEAVRSGLLTILSEFNVQVLLDAPCGDFNWMKEVPLDGIEYIGVDVVPEMITENSRRYDAPGRTFRCLDITRGPLPRADLIFCRDALVHLADADVLEAIKQFKRSGSKFLAATTFPAQSGNRDIETGYWRPINLEKPPFHFPRPIRTVTDGCLFPGYTDKLIAVWRLADLPDHERSA